MSVQIEQLRSQDRDRYETFLETLAGDPEASAQLTFFHSWQWGEVLADRTAGVQRVALVRDGELVGVAQVALQRDKRVPYWYSPRGIAMDYRDPALVAQAYGALRDHFRRRQGAAFLRVDPAVTQGEPAEAAIDSAGAKRAAIFHQVERCWITDVLPDEPTQLAWMKEHGMRSNVPRFVKKARKAGVSVRASEDPADLETLIGMLHSLDERKGGIGMHQDEHYRVQFAALAPAGYQRVFLAELDGRVGAATLIAVYGGEASFLHGASSSAEEFRKLAPSYQLHFETMRWMAEHRPQVRRYNFWGIVSDENRRDDHPRHGYSEFKRGFGGQKVEYLRAREFVYRRLPRTAVHLLDVYRTKRYQND